MEVSVGGTNKMSLRETPGIVTVITGNEIRTSGARDFMDLLRTVPGFEFSGDIENTVGLGVRGNYAQEGKVLLLIDGQEINETGYGTIVWGNRFLTDNIQKIEIIRGPGSAIYGGMAELAVINVITKSGQDINGGYGSSSYGVSNSTHSRINGQAGFGRKINSDLDIAFTAGYSEANRSNETEYYETNYLDEDVGASANQSYADSSKIKSVDLNFKINYKNLTINSIYQDYKIQFNTPTADWLQFGGLYLGAKYDWKISEKLTLIPQINWKQVNPWTYSGSVTGNSLLYFNKTQKFNERLTLKFKPSDKLKFTTGMEASQDRALKSNDSLLFSNGKPSLHYNNIAFFGEALLQHKIANFVIGARYDKHNQFGDAFVPRFAVTKLINDLHFKVLLSRAFRAPSVFYLESNPSIKPEFTTVGEIEIG